MLVPALPDSPSDRIVHPATLRLELAARVPRRPAVIALNPSVVVVGHVMPTRGLTAQAARHPISAHREIYLSHGVEELLTRR